MGSLPFASPIPRPCWNLCVPQSYFAEFREQYPRKSCARQVSRLEGLGRNILQHLPCQWSKRHSDVLLCLSNFDNDWPFMVEFEEKNKREIYDLFYGIHQGLVPVPQDCARPLYRLQEHNLLSYTNEHTIQVYCFHEDGEKNGLSRLINYDQHFQQNAEPGRILEAQHYQDYIKSVLGACLPYLIWEGNFEEGIDMEALSPRDANAQVRKQPASKVVKPAPAKLATKEKDHPPPPPRDVYEPASTQKGYKDGAIYQTGKLLGKGGFAICYEGRHAATKEIFALKIVRSYMPLKKMEQKFQTELQIHSKMDHMNIVRFHRAFSFEKATYIVLELCPNGSLMDMVKKRRYVTEPEVRFWTVQMAGAIKYMHAKGIIHRDLKMGNIFLDKDMNVKIGDFGLAALFMSDKDMKSCRRTTLCGTPNYIAPEILAKDRQGHDHAVDIWSLGIIIFALLTGKPPFQSTTADEIYRKARELEYDWPQVETSENFISQPTKDLVSELLQEAAKRPDPDAIVQHPFFTSGWVPQADEMTTDLRDRHPSPDRFVPTGLRGSRTNYYIKNLKKLCAMCDVGPWHSSTKSLTSTYREVAAEEKAGLTPAVPLPENVVYRRFDEWLKEQKQEVVEQGENAKAAGAVLNKIHQPLPPFPVDELALPPTRVPTQSFAAQQRARPHGIVAGQPLRPRPAAETAEKSARPVITIASRHAKSSSSQESKQTRRSRDVEDRLAVDLVKQLGKVEKERKSPEVEAPTITIKTPPSLFNPLEKLDSLPNTKPDHILQGLRKLLAELERALNSRSPAPEAKTERPSPPVVVKWVDYTNKFGLGYILSNNSVGCIFRSLPANPSDPSQGEVPPACVVVRDAETHLRSRHNEAYPDRKQIVPINGPNIEFYENRGDKGIFRGTVNPQNFKLTIGEDGEAAKLSRGQDEWDDRKREKIVLWKKFANYMTAFGRDMDNPQDDGLERSKQEKLSDSIPAGNVVTFYQRFGDVGVWAFYDGHFQFNYPDHTKVLISADGTWCDFYHLPIDSARDLREKGVLPSKALDDRQHLSFPLQTLLNFITKPSRVPKPTTRKRPDIDPTIQGIPEANDFRKKVEFIREVVKEWVQNGGLGNSNMKPETRLRWMGERERVNVKAPYKHVWVTVGARNGDERRVALFDPKKPEEIVQDTN